MTKSIDEWDMTNELEMLLEEPPKEKMSLSASSVDSILSGASCDHLKPVLQICSIIDAKNGRYKLILSDGKRKITALLATQLKHLIDKQR